MVDTPHGVTEGEPGYLEKLSALEDAVPALAETLQVATSIISEIATAFTENIPATTAAKSAREKVVIADRISQKVDNLATRLAIAAGDITQNVNRLEPGISVLRRQLETSDDETERNEVSAALVSLCDAALGSIPATSVFRTSLRGEHATVRMRVVNERVAHALDAIVEAAERIGGWKKYFDPA